MAYPPWLIASGLLHPGSTAQLGPGCTLDPTAFPACVSVWSSEVRVSHAHTSGDWIAVALLNMGENTTTAACDLRSLPGVLADTLYSVVDIWNGTAYGNVGHSLCQDDAVWNGTINLAFC